MKISHVVENLHRGGLERMVLDLVGEQLRAGHDCQVVCLYDLGQLASELLDVGVPVHACGKRNGFDLRAVTRLRRFLSQHRSGVVHSHNMACNYHAALALTGMPRYLLINTRHGMARRMPSNRLRRLYRRSLRRTAAVVSVCEAAREQFLQRGMVGADKLVTIPNGIQVDRFRPASDSARQRLLSELGLPAATRLAGTVGRLNQVKAPLTLIRSFAALRLSMPETALLLIGAGPLYGQLHDLIVAEHMQEHIRLLGDRSDVHELLPGLDLFAMASLTEGYSMALLEACASGLPIVATAVGGNAEIVREGINGHLVPPHDPEALSAAMRSVLADPEAASAMGQAGRRWVLEHGSLQTMAQRYEQLYRQCR